MRRPQPAIFLLKKINRFAPGAIQFKAAIFFRERSPQNILILS